MGSALAGQYMVHGYMVFTCKGKAFWIWDWDWDWDGEFQHSPHGHIVSTNGMNSKVDCLRFQFAEFNFIFPISAAPWPPYPRTIALCQSYKDN